MMTTRSKRGSIGAALFVLATIVSLMGCERRHSAAESIELAKGYSASGRPEAAIIELKNAVQSDASNAQARLMLAAAYVEVGQAIQAEIELRRLVDAGMNPQETIGLLGRALLLQGNFNRIVTEINASGGRDARQKSELFELRGQAFLALQQRGNAAKEFAQALDNWPGYPEALVGQAQVALAGADFNAATSLLAQALVNSPDMVSALLLKGDIERYLEKPKDAWQSYQRILEKHPTNVAALSSSTYLLIIEGNGAAAAENIAKIRKFGNGAATANFLQAMLDFKQKNFAGARDAIQKSLVATPGSLAAVMLSGSIEYSLGAYEQAERLMRQVVSLSPGTIYARKVLALTLLKQGRGADAAEVLEPVARGSDDMKVLSILGEAYSMARQYGKATEYFARASDAEPANASDKLRLGASRLAMGESDRAMREFESAVQLDQDDSRADYALITTQIRRGEYDKASAAADALTKRQPTNPLGWNLRGGIYLAQKNEQAAREAFEHALSVEPGFLPAAMNLAKLDLQDKRPAEARARMQRVVDKDPKNVSALVALSNLLREIGAPRAETIGLLERAREADPKAVEPRLLLVQTLVSSEPKRAGEVARELQVLDPGNPRVLQAVGMSQLALGEQGAALATYGKLVQIEPRSIEARRRLADLFLAAGNQAGALRELRSALEINAKDLDTRLMLIKIEGLAGHTPEALKLAQQLQAEAPKLVIGHVLEGDIWMAARKPAQAATAYERGISISKSSPLLMKLHSAYGASGKSAEGNALLRAWLVEHPDDVIVRTYFANYSMRHGQPSTAIEQYEFVLAKDAANVLALNDLATLYGTAKDPRALPLAERAYRAAPNNIHVADTFGWLLVSNGQVERGNEILAKAIDAVPTAYGTRLRLAKGYAKAGDRIRARQQFESVANSGTDAKERLEASTALEALNASP